MSGSSKSICFSGGNNIPIYINPDGILVCENSKFIIPEVVSNVKSVSCGDYHLCVLLNDGTIRTFFCKFNHIYQPNPIDLPPIESMSCGIFHTSVITTSGKIISWSNLIERNHKDNYDIYDNSKRAKHISCGFGFTCVIFENNDYKLIDHIIKSTNRLPKYFQNVKNVSCSGAYITVLFLDNSVLSFTMLHSTFICDERFLNVKIISSGQYHSVLYRYDKEMISWGSYTLNENFDFDVVDIVCGNQMTCLILSNGKVIILSRLKVLFDFSNIVVKI